MDEPKKKVWFVHTKDDFDLSTTCGLCGAPLNEKGDYDGEEIERLRGSLETILHDCTIEDGRSPSAVLECIQHEAEKALEKD